MPHAARLVQCATKPSAASAILELLVAVAAENPAAFVDHVTGLCEAAATGEESLNSAVKIYCSPGFDKVRCRYSKRRSEISHYSPY